MKKVAMFVSIIVCICLVGCKRYEFTEKQYSSDENINSIKIEEQDTPIIIELDTSEEKGITIQYFESKQETYSFELEYGFLKIKKNDSSNGNGFYLSGDDGAYDNLVLKIRLSKDYLDKVNIIAQESAVQIKGGQINELYIETSYDSIDLDHVAIGDSFTGITRYDSIKAMIVGDPAEFSVKSSAKDGVNNLQNHSYNGSKSLDLQTEDGDIDVTFVEEK